MLSSARVRESGPGTCRRTGDSHHCPPLTPYQTLQHQELRLWFNTAAMEARATNAIYISIGSHPCPTSTPPVPTMDGIRNRRLSTTFLEFVSQGGWCGACLCPQSVRSATWTLPKATKGGALCGRPDRAAFSRHKVCGLGSLQPRVAQLLYSLVSVTRTSPSNSKVCKSITVLMYSGSLMDSFVGYISVTGRVSEVHRPNLQSSCWAIGLPHCPQNGPLPTEAHILTQWTK